MKEDLPDYHYTLERLNKLTYVLTVNERDIKKRLIEALTYYWISADDLPEKIREFADEIDTVVSCIPKDEYDNTYKNSLANKHLKTCSKIASQIVDLEQMLTEYIDDMISNN